MKMQIVVGAQWGDEGKGKIVDFLSESADYIVRYQGGNNAGHTVIVGPETFKLHLVPSGICRGKQSVLGNGVVINPVALAQEIKQLEARGIEVQGKLWLSSRAHLILAEHIQRDMAQEEARSTKVGTTGKGIGPAYTDKITRKGIRLGEWTYSETLSSEEHEALQFLQPLIADTTQLLHEALENGKKILLEGAQGTFLDIDHGTYPFVTSSNCSSGGACTGTGLPPTAITAVNGILKAYTTRVGNGPFPTELLDETGEFLQQKGHEFGTTTGRKRRCGWLDLVMANYARRINGIDRWSITKLDVLSGLEEIKVCTGYRYQGELLKGYPADVRTLEGAEPVYETHPGWQESLDNCRSLNDLPEAARNYLKMIEDKTQTPIALVSWGPERTQTLIV
ncbi:MAG: adenylosuccinate synthetase [Candidatus Sericytochromatia bacterium]|nr:adenylosuccinate synthetase [Candidatus Sericytochromatia bacterium]